MTSGRVPTIQQLQAAVAVKTGGLMVGGLICMRHSIPHVEPKT